MEKTNKDVMQESAQVLAGKIDIPDGPNVAPSPQEHLAAQGIVKPPLHAGDVQPGDNADSIDKQHPSGGAAGPDSAIPKGQERR